MSARVVVRRYDTEVWGKGWEWVRKEAPVPGLETLRSAGPFPTKDAAWADYRRVREEEGT